MSPPAGARLPAAVAVTVLFASSAYAGIGAALQSYAPGTLSLLRMLVASAVLALWAAVSRALAGGARYKADGRAL